MLRLFFILPIFCIACATKYHAPSDSNTEIESRYSKSEDIELMLMVMDIEEIFFLEVTKNIFYEVYKELAKEKDLSDDEIKEIKSFVQSEISIVRKNHKEEIEIILEGLNRMYDKEFYHKQILDLTNFYKTETGQAVLKKGNEMAQGAKTVGLGLQLFLVEKIMKRNQKNKRFPANLKPNILKEEEK